MSGRTDAGSAERICLVLLTGLGDVVMGLPLASALKRQRPGRHITWVAEPAPSAVLANHLAVDDVIVYEKSRGAAGVRDLWRDMRRRRFDLTLNLNVYFKSVWPTLFSRGNERVGFGPDRARDGVWLTANRHLPRRPRRHTLDMFLEFAEFVGVNPHPLQWGIRFDPAEIEAQREFFAPLRDRPVAAIVAASANARKDWIPARYAELVDALEHDLGFRAVLVGGPGERETGLAREIMHRTRGRPVWALGDGVRRMMYLLAGSDLLIAPDTGPVHLARALAVPVVGLYGHTNPWRVGPYRRYEDLWVDRYTDPGETPDPSRYDPKQGRMEQITVADVLERVERAVARYGVAARARGGGV